MESATNIDHKMALKSLLISHDLATVEVLRPTLEKLSVSVEVCSAVKAGNEILVAEKFDAVVLDCDDLPGGLSVLQTLRKGASNRNSVAFAILNGKTDASEAFKMGANFVLQKPVSQLNATRCFNAALGFMHREQRRYFRHPVEMQVVILFNNGKELKAKSTNISEGGMAISYRGEFAKESISRIQFTLPGANVSMEFKAEVAWADIGRAGLRFVEVAQSSQHQLDQWLAQRMETAAGV